MTDETKPASEAEVKEAMYALWPTIGQAFTPKETVWSMLTAARALGVLMPDDAARLREDLARQCAQTIDAARAAGIERTERDALAARLKVAEEALGKLIALAESDAVQIDGEWGNCRTLEQMEAEGALPSEIIAARAALTPPPEAKDAAA